MTLRVRCRACTYNFSLLRTISGAVGGLTPPPAVQYLYCIRYKDKHIYMYCQDISSWGIKGVGCTDSSAQCWELQKSSMSQRGAVRKGEWYACNVCLLVLFCVLSCAM
jgi:hypothetical protein